MPKPVLGTGDTKINDTSDANILENHVGLSRGILNIPEPADDSTIC